MFADDAVVAGLRTEVTIAANQANTNRTKASTAGARRADLPSLLSVTAWKLVLGFGRIYFLLVEIRNGESRPMKSALNLNPSSRQRLHLPTYQIQERIASQSSEFC